MTKNDKFTRTVFPGVTVTEKPPAPPDPQLREQFARRFADHAEGEAAFRLLHEAREPFHFVHITLAMMARAGVTDPDLRSHLEAARDSIAAILALVDDK